MLWGFPDRKRSKNERYSRNWKDFVKWYNRISTGDIVVFQLYKPRYLIHAIGVVKDRHYDDETPVFREEDDSGDVIYPWRITFSLMIFSPEPIVELAVPTEDYLRGYGLGKLSRPDFDVILGGLRDEVGLRMKVG
jgi:hypothetical protein